ncbi:MAG: hypothetical protein CMO98_11810 [Woeseia sp.]|nr:hypothetical protein [Woeseia sp.]|tara:strand:- start:692 stop:1084 length:393 start_codon:yes stop_codon:yes gene_type:complete
MLGFCRRKLGPSPQTGLTTLGFVILITFIGVFIFGASRLLPAYLNHAKISGILEDVHLEFDKQRATGAAIRKSIDRRLQIETVNLVTSRDIKITSDSKKFLINTQYDHTTHFIGNLYFTSKFEKEVVILR